MRLRTARLTYVVAELHRRLGDVEQAEVWYRLALTHQALDPEVRALIREKLTSLEVDEAAGGRTWMAVLILFLTFCAGRTPRPRKSAR